MARSLKPLAQGDLLNRILDGTLFAIGVYEAGADALYSGQNAAIGTSAGTLGAQACSEVLIQASYDNGTKTLSLGQNGTSTPIQLKAGDTLVVRTKNVNLIYILSSSGTGTANWLAAKDISP